MALSIAHAEYDLADPVLKAVVIDSDPKESFLGCNSTVRAVSLWVAARHCLCMSPIRTGCISRANCFIASPPTRDLRHRYRGNDLYLTTHTAVYRLEGAVNQA